ncbi:MAG: hypothetical protein NVS3B27_18580 [Novosphingobium sp.]
MPWYEGSSLLHHLENVHVASDRNLIDARFPVQYVVRPQSEQFPDYRGYAGQIASGSLRPGEEVCVLPGGRRTTIAAIRDRSHWNISNINPKDPVTLGLCSQRELDALVAKAAKKAGTAEDEAASNLRLGNDRDALIEELRAEREVNTRAAAEVAQEAEAAAWLLARKAEGLSDS